MIKKLTKTISYLMLLLLISPAYSKLQHLADNQLLTLEIAKAAPTRLILDTEKIADVFFYPEEAAKVILHQSGAVFVVPVKDHNEVYITIMGENGSTQDCLLTFVDQQPEPVRLVSSDKITIASHITKKEDDK